MLMNGRWTRRLVLAVAALLVQPLGIARPGHAAEPASGTLSLTFGSKPPKLSWNGLHFAAAANTSNTFDAQRCAPSYPGGPDDPGAVPGVEVCDVFEFTVVVPRGYYDHRNGGVQVDVEWLSADNDFDMFVYKKPPPGQPVGKPVAGSERGATDSEHVRVPRAEGTYLVRVNPWSVVDSAYSGQITVYENPPLPNVSGGLEQTQASGTGYLSYSEPHISVDPRDPNHLVGGSKMYQNLPEYLFKIGTFVSFDGGQTWTDNGHLPGYPAQSGAEGDDYYVTSDIWTAQDDEGNAYAMVLDHPPTDSLTGAGWGMTLHKSTDGGRTWSGRIPMHENADAVSKHLFLDDKNTLAVDNSGTDGDGKTGNLYGCWSFDAAVANLAVYVTTSTDAGATWSDPVNVSGADRTVLGCHVVVGPPVIDGGPGVLYVFWRDFGSGRNRMAKSIDGGLTFSLPITVNTYRESPSPFPGSGFRNGNIPAGAVDPDDRNTVYLSYMDYHSTKPDEDCPEAGDDPIPEQVCDADVMVIKSTDGGTTWGNPIRVNQDPVGNGKDQFQQQLAITPSGQLNMMWFDRRNDPANFYIDTFFARSNDGGQTWTETRVTKSMWDPSINPPISGSGEFIGDYQGLIATDTGGAVPFWNDTSLAQLPGNHPRYSPYQEAFSARIPNTAEFGGP